MSRAKGNRAEERAAAYLYGLGFSVLERNCYSRFGEIDIIAMKDEVLHFVEVKSGLSYEQAVQNITPKKLQRIVRTVDTYLKKNALGNDYCIDAIIVTSDEIELIENVTL